MDAAAQSSAQGYASMDAIATTADVSSRRLQSVRIEEELFKSIITARSRGARAGARLASASREVLLDSRSDALAYTAQALGFYRTIVAAGQRFPEIGLDFYEAGPKQTHKMLADWMAREDRFRRLDTGDPALAAEHFLSLIMGHVQTRGLLGVPGEPSVAELERRARFCVDAFMRAFARVDRP
jgi:hypothetical protein